MNPIEHSAHALPLLWAVPLIIVEGVLMSHIGKLGVLKVLEALPKRMTDWTTFGGGRYVCLSLSIDPPIMSCALVTVWKGIGGEVA
jgi:hypothetical protein